MTIPYRQFIIFVLLFLIGNVSITYTQENQDKSISIKKMLAAGPFQIMPPALIRSDLENVEAKFLLEYQFKDKTGWWPKEDDPVLWDKDNDSEWDELDLSEEEGVILESDNKESYQIYYLAFYVNSKTYFKGQLKIFSHHLFEVYEGGNKLGSKTTADKEKPQEENFTNCALSLEPGKHLILIKSIFDKTTSLSWNIKLKLQSEVEVIDQQVTTSINPTRRITLEDLLDIPEMKEVSISPDGKYAVINFRQIKEDTKGYDSWLDIFETKTGSRIFPKQMTGNVSKLKWVPKGDQFSYITTENGKSDIYVYSIISGKTEKILNNIENLSDYSWAKNGNVLIYSITEEPGEDTEGLKKLQGMPDRWPSWRYKDELYLLNVKMKTRQQLTKSQNSSTLYDIHPKGNKILLGQSEPDFENRPYFKNYLYELNLNTMQLDSIWSGYWFNSASYAPNGNQLLVLGSPSIFDGIGKNVSTDKIPNEYDNQAFIFDLNSKSVKAITKSFDPSVRSAVWINNTIYLQVNEKSLVQLYAYHVKSEKFSKIESGVETIHKIDFALNGSKAIYTGSGAIKPHTAYLMDLENKRYKVITEPSKEVFKNIELSSVKRWTFKNKNDVEIEGRVYLPPDFDANKKYPCIVYYYGGVSPVGRSFGGRYPKNFYVAHDYVVYVLQPSGCVGFGQDFSARHVNDWGKIVADEIIDGVSKFLDAHPFVDRTKVGCIGASYGGFMTMLLMTKTDMFAAAISHAGISDISSYWGEGFWGYLYNARSAANSFPWNRKDIYVDQSPLFGVENIKTPILLLHGDADTNVPPGESRQFYAALKLLGKEVELIEVAGQNHWILEHNKRKKWTKTIVAWFDKWLKGDDSWWKTLYAE